MTPRTGRKTKSQNKARRDPRDNNESLKLKHNLSGPLSLGLLLVILTILAYQPIWKAGFVWDDDDYVTQNRTLHDLDGLRRIWLEPGAVPQYYPLVHTTFWVEYHLYGLDPLGYHLINVLLHALGAILLWRLLLRLQLPGAWFGAAIFALHPVCVESVAWITERKNVLSGALYFATALAYMRATWLQQEDTVNYGGSCNSDKQSTSPDNWVPSRWSWYFTSLFLFILALLSKTVVCSLPAALLLARWWKEGRLRRSDLLSSLPFFTLGAPFGFLTIWMEKHVVHAQGVDWSLTFLQRCIIAGRALWFYAGKLVWPVKLTFIYPRWEISATAWQQWLPLLGAVGVVVVLWLIRRRIGRGPLTGVLFFAGTLLPALGFVNTYPMLYSFVADHFQYLASVGLVATAAAGMITGANYLIRRKSWLVPTFCAGLLSVLAVLSWQQSGSYRDVESLWRATLTRNPRCLLANFNLGVILDQQGRTDEAIAQYEKTLEMDPDKADAHYNIARLLAQSGQIEEALVHYKRLFEMGPDQSAEAHNSYGSVLDKMGNLAGAIKEYQKAVTIRPDLVLIQCNLGAALARNGQLDEAMVHFQEALKIQPDFVETHFNLGLLFLQLGRKDESRKQFLEVLHLRPDFTIPEQVLRQLEFQD
jgi:protein O-mannosyl-transferase